MSDKRDAEECVSDTYMRLWSSIPPEKPCCLRAYLARIARNCALDRAAYNSAAQRSSALTVAFEELEPCLSFSDGDPQQNLNSRDFGDFINAFLRSCPANARNYFILRYWYGDSIAEIADRFGVTQARVKTSLFRTRSKLRTAMEKEMINI